MKLYLNKTISRYYFSPFNGEKLFKMIIQFYIKLTLFTKSLFIEEQHI